MRVLIVGISSMLLGFLAIFLVNRLYPMDFIHSQIITFMLLFLFIFSAVACSAALMSDEKKFVKIGFGGFTYLLMINFFLCMLQVANAIPAVPLWFIMFSSAVVTVMLTKAMEFEPSPEEIDEPIQHHVAEGTCFHQPAFDDSLAKFEQDMAFFTQHQSLIDVESMHRMEKMVHDLQQTAVYYQHTQGKYRKQADEYIEGLCLRTEALAEELEERIQHHYVREIEKLATIHQMKSKERANVNEIM